MLFPNSTKKQAGSFAHDETTNGLGSKQRRDYKWNIHLCQTHKHVSKQQKHMLFFWVLITSIGHNMTNLLEKKKLELAFMREKSLCKYYGYIWVIWVVFLCFSGKKTMILRIHKRLKHFRSYSWHKTRSSLSIYLGLVHRCQGPVHVWREWLLFLEEPLSKFSLENCFFIISVASGPFPQEHWFPRWSFYTGLVGTKFLIIAECYFSKYLINADLWRLQVALVSFFYTFLNFPILFYRC